MELYDCRFFHETLAVIFEQRRQVITTLDDMAMRLEELEHALSDKMSEHGYNYDGSKYFDGQFSRWTQNNNKRFITCNCPECSHDYMVD